MTNNVADRTEKTRATALVAAILGAPTTYIPRREVIVEWLNALLSRMRKKDYLVSQVENDDLVAVDDFLRSCNVSVGTVAVG